MMPSESVFKELQETAENPVLPIPGLVSHCRSTSLKAIEEENLVFTETLASLTKNRDSRIKRRKMTSSPRQRLTI